MSKFAHAIVALMSIECFITSLAFAYTGNWKMAAYWICACGINSIAYTL